MTQGSDYSSDTFATFYDHLDVYVNRSDVDFFVSEAVAARGPVLELGCGTGRVLLPCAGRRHYLGIGRFRIDAGSLPGQAGVRE